MTYQEWKSKGPGRVLTNLELSRLSDEVDTLSDQMDYADNDAWIDWAVDRLEEIRAIIEDSLTTKRSRDIGLRVINGGAA